MTDKEIMEILTKIMLQRAYSMKHNLIARTYINIVLKTTKSQCNEDLWNFYDSDLDDLQALCKICDLDLETANKFYNVLYNGFCESKIIINNYYKERSIKS